MRYKGKDINLMNFQEEFKGFSPELIDEVVTSIVYDVEIGAFIEKFGDNPELIKQIKWGILDKLPVRYFQVGNADVIKALRKAHKAGLTLTTNELDVLIVLNDTVALLYIEWLSRGVNLEGYKLTRININTARNITPYLYQGKDMRRFCTGKSYSSVFIESVLTLIDKGVNVDKLFSGVWRDSVVSFIAVKQNVDLINSLISAITSETKESVVYALWGVLALGIRPERLIKRINSISSVRLEIVAKAFKNGLEWQEFDDPSLAVEHLNNMYQVRLHQVKAKKITL